jgi:hypothetical protein
MTQSAGLADQTLFTTAQVAERLQLPISTIRDAIPSGDSMPSDPPGHRQDDRIAPSATEDVRTNATPRKEDPDAS